MIDEMKALCKRHEYSALISIMDPVAISSSLKHDLVISPYTLYSVGTLKYSGSDSGSGRNPTSMVKSNRGRQCQGACTARISRWCLCPLPFALCDGYFQESPLPHFPQAYHHQRPQGCPWFAWLTTSAADP